jgi:hypothetical protein
MEYAFCLTVAKVRPVRLTISLALPFGKSFFTSLISSSVHKFRRVFFFFFLLFAIGF